MIADLYRGDLRLADQLGPAPGAYQDARGELYRQCEELEAKLPTDLQADLEQLVIAAGDALVAAEEEAFTLGFRMCGQLLYDMMV